MPKVRTEADIGAVRVIRSIADNQSYQLFKTIASSNGIDSERLMPLSSLSRKQYYSRLSRLISVGLVKRKGGRYGLTSTGRIMQRIMAIIEYASANQYKLKAVDALETSGELPQEQRAELIGKVIEDKRIMQMLSD